MNFKSKINICLSLLMTIISTLNLKSLNQVKNNDNLICDKNLISSLNISDEFRLREFPEEYFKVINNVIHIKDNQNGLHVAGKFSFPSLESLIHESNKIKTEGNGSLDIIYSNNKHLVEVARLLDCRYFDLISVASNFNAIETVNMYDGNKQFIDYLYDLTQGPDSMMKFPCTSLTLLHLINGKNIKLIENLMPDCIDLIEQKDDQCELNLLKLYNIETSNGYLINGNLNDDFKNEENDMKYRVVYIENAPILFEGGERYDSNGIKINSNKKFLYCKYPKTTNLFINASIPYENNEYGYIGTSIENIKAHLRRHYKSLIYLCKSKGIKKALLPLIGSGAFGVPITLHYEILYELRNLIKDSNTHFFLNAFNEPDYENIPHCESFNFKEIKSNMDLQ